MVGNPRGLLELGLRLRARRDEAGLDVATIAERAQISPSDIEAFEAGQGGLGVAALMRVAKVLGVPVTSFAHTRSPVVAAPVEPSVVLKGPGAAWLRDADRDALAAGLRRAQAFTEAGELLEAPRLADRFQPTAAPDRNAHFAGYDAANQARGLLIRTGPLRSLARLLEDQFNILVLRRRFTDPRVVGAACRTRGARLVAVNMEIQVETTRRYALAHELGHQLLDLDEAGVLADEMDDGIAWFDKSPREKRADAFAAMFLAPASAVAEIIGQPRGDAAYDEAKDIVERVRARLGMGFSAAAWHLHNLKYYAQQIAETLQLAEQSAAPIGEFEEETRFDGLERRVLEAFARDIISRGRARELLGGVDPEALAGSL